MSNITLSANLQSVTISYTFKTIYINFKPLDNLIRDNKIILQPKSLARIRYKFTGDSDLESLGKIITKNRAVMTFDGSQFEHVTTKDGLLIPQFTVTFLE